MRKFSLFFAVFVCAFSFSFAQILVNQVGYEKSGAKRAVIKSSPAITGDAFSVINENGTVVFNASLGPSGTVAGWSGTFRVADFSDLRDDGEYRLRVGSATSDKFAIGEKILQSKTGASQVSFFNGMRNTDDRDRNLAINGSSQKHNIYGGWWDATGDPGKHLSHLSYANYFNPQQIPLVVWALLQANEFQSAVFSTAAKAEAAWGADYLLRALSTTGYFYMSVFDKWGDSQDREICAWSGENGVPSANYQSAMREGGGMSIAALARASKAGISGDSSSAKYLAGAIRAYAHLKANPTAYQDDYKENIIDDYTGLLAASELYNATGEQTYLTDANSRAASLLSRQSGDGWFYTHKNNEQNERPFYHAADEGLPVVALVRYVETCNLGNVENIRQAIRKNFQWYINITSQDYNPFEYVKMYGTSGESTDPGSVDLARRGTATASYEEGQYTADKAIDGDAGTRWSGYNQQSGANNDNHWIIVDLGEVYKVNKVILKWEASYGKAYNIDVSTDKISWTTVATITGNTQLDKVHSFDPVNARYVRMNGKERGFEYGGFSLYLFEIYGEQEQPPAPKLPARFFMPHDNETNYWWQGENARIASLSAAFTMGAQLADPSGELWYNTLFALATAQLDWILGKNPFEVSMMYGFGNKNYPNYINGSKKLNIIGGICNGITAMDKNESNLAWKPYEDSNWQNWRWIEQWLPHNAWYLTAISALSYRIDNPITPIRKSNFAKAPNLKILVVNGRSVNVELPFAADNRTSIDIYNMHGQKLFSYSVPAGNLSATVEMPSHVKHGAYILSVKNMAGKTVSSGFIFGK